MNSEFRFRISAKFSLSILSQTIYMYNYINNTDFGLNKFLEIIYFWPQK